MRTRVIIGAYLVACFAAAAALFVVVTASLDVRLAFLVALWAIPAVTLLAALPASAAIFYAERHRYLSPLFYTAVGFVTVIVAAVELYLTDGLPSPGRRHVPGGFRETMQLVVVFGSIPGLIAGLVYWSIAGRNAGKALHT